MANNSKEDQDGKKVFDVAKPEATTPNTGSKPMVIGHKSLASDPSVKEKTQDGDKVSEELDKTTARTASKIKITPLSDDEKTARSDAESKSSNENLKSVDTKNETSDKASAEKKGTTPAEEDTNKSKDVKPDSSTEKEANKEPASEEAKPTSGEEADEKKEDDNENKKEDRDIAREKALQEMITSKKYEVPIKEANGGGFGSFLITLLVVALIGLVVGVVLIDAEIVNDTTINLPFDFL